MLLTTSRRIRSFSSKYMTPMIWTSFRIFKSNNLSVVSLSRFIKLLPKQDKLTPSSWKILLWRNHPVKRKLLPSKKKQTTDRQSANLMLRYLVLVTDKMTPCSSSSLPPKLVVLVVNQSINLKTKNLRVAFLSLDEYFQTLTHLQIVWRQVKLSWRCINITLKVTTKLYLRKRQLLVIWIWQLLSKWKLN